MARQFIYHMSGLSKTYPGGKKVLDNVHLSFYPDAKIGVLGVNGSGKSSLLRIMAGIDKEFNGEAWVGAGREGRLPAAGAAARSVEDRAPERHAGRRRKQAILDRYNELAVNYSDETADEMTQAAGRDRGAGPVGSRRPCRPGDGSAALPAGRCRSERSVGR